MKIIAEIPGLEDLLKNHKSEQEMMMEHSWQSHNHVKSKVYDKLGKDEFLMESKNEI